MNQVFDFKRWLLLTGMHWSENRKKYLWSVAAITGGLIVWFAFMMLVENWRPFPEEMQVGTYYGGLCLVGALFASMFFADLSSTPKAINYLSVPASTFEKLLVALVFGFILFFICYTVIFYLVDFPMVKIADNMRYSAWLKEHAAGDHFQPERISNVFVMFQEYRGHRTSNPYAFFVLVYVALQSAFILGSVYFPSYSFIKTAVAISVIMLFAVFFFIQVSKLLVPQGVNFQSFTSYRLTNTVDVNRIVKLPDWINSVLLFLFKYSVGPILWIVTYFRLKEKEV